MEQLAPADGMLTPGLYADCEAELSCSVCQAEAWSSPTRLRRGKTRKTLIASVWLCSLEQWMGFIRPPHHHAMP